MEGKQAQIRSCFRACVKPLDKNLGHVIRDRRKMRGLTQEELARRCGVSRRHLIAIERGANFSVAVLVALAGELEEIAPVVAELLTRAARLRALPLRRPLRERHHA
jgi:transcriptional regulator with XRE-family HTH domain